MRRRNFLQLAGFGSAATLLGVGAYAYSGSVEEATVGLITKEFHFLKLDPAGVRQFVADYYRKAGPARRNPLTEWKTKTYHLLSRRSGESALVKTFTTLYLLSTDFFQHRMDERRVVKYLGWYNPHKTPCANPFSFLYYPPAVS